MASTIRIKRSTGSSAPTSLENAEIAFAEGVDKLYYGKGTGGAGGSATSVELIGGKGAFCDLTTTQTVAGAKTFSDNVVVTGNLTVNGTTTTVNSTTTTVDDPVFTIGGDSTPGSDDNKDRGIEFKWHSGSSAKVGFFGFDDSTGKFTFIPDATNSSEVFSGSAGTIVAALEGNATTATALASGRTISMTGDVAWTSASFDGSGNVTGAGTIQTGAVEHAMLAGDCIDGDNIQDDVLNSEHYAAGSIDHEHLANDIIDGDNIQDDVIDSEHIVAGAVDLEHMASDSVDEDNLKISNSGSNGQFLSKQSGDTGGLTWATPSSSVPTTITVADESSDTTCFPLFATAATGDLGPKSGSNLTFNSSSGVLTATQVDGIIDGGTF